MSNEVYTAINAVTADLAKCGIGKDRKNQQQGYAFRGIDDVQNTLAPLLAKHGLVILPRILERSCEERQTKSGGTLFYTTVCAEFDLVCAKDGSTHVVRVYGEAMDSADKSTNKAMSASYKYMALLTFCIPVDPAEDADAVTPEPGPKAEPPAKPKAVPKPTPKLATAEQRHELRTLSAHDEFDVNQRTKLVQAAMDETTPADFADRLIAKAKETLAAKLDQDNPLLSHGVMN